MTLESYTVAMSVWSCVTARGRSLLLKGSSKCSYDELKKRLEKQFVGKVVKEVWQARKTCAQPHSAETEMKKHPCKHKQQQKRNNCDWSTKDWFGRQRKCKNKPTMDTVWRPDRNCALSHEYKHRRDVASANCRKTLFCKMHLHCNVLIWLCTIFASFRVFFLVSLLFPPRNYLRSA